MHRTNFRSHKHAFLILLLVITSLMIGELSLPAFAMEVNDGTLGSHHYTIYYLDSNNLQFRTTRPDKNDHNLLLCIPAAFTDAYNGIDGLAITDGKVIASNIDNQVGGAAVILNGDFDIVPTDGGKLLAGKFIEALRASGGSLFQQFQLVRDGAPESFRDKSLFQRRAMVTFREGRKAVIESKEPLTLNQFAHDLANQDVLNALYTDMGDWDEGWYRHDDGKLQVIGHVKSATDKQTNWVVFAKSPDNKPRRDDIVANWLQHHWAPASSGPAAAVQSPAFWTTSILYGEFPLPRLSSGTDMVRLFRGRYTKADVDVTVEDLAVGTVDGMPAAVAYTSWSTGGSGQWEVLTLYRIQKGRITPVGQHDLEDRAQVNSVHIANGSVVLDWIKHGPQDAAINPTIHEVIHLHSKDFHPIEH